MTAAALVADLRKRGVALAFAGDRLRWRAPKGVMTEAMVDALRRHKAGLMAALEARPAADDALAEWGDATDAVEWFLASEPSAEPFVLLWNERRTRPAITITAPARYWQDLKTDIAAGPGIRRDTYGAVRSDLRRLHSLFGGHG